MTQPVWSTPVGSIGGYPSSISMSKQLIASPVLPATTLNYVLLSGTLPTGVSLSTSGLISGIPENTSFNTVSTTFVVRAIDDLGNISDRAFTMSVSGISEPAFITSAGNILTTQDSLWVELPIQYTTPTPADPVTVRLIQGELPPGLEINETGLIRGYPAPPIVNNNLSAVSTGAISVLNNQITCLSITGFNETRPIVFSGTTLGGLNAGQTYFIKDIPTSNTITVSATPGGPELTLTDDAGYMDVFLPSITVGQPITRTYTFLLRLENSTTLNNTTTVIESFNITVINQNAPASEGGPSKPPDTRVPAVFNTRPPTYDIDEDVQYYGYYVLPSNNGITYPILSNAYIGKFASDNIFAFKVIGHDFDNNVLEYVYTGLPLGLTGDATTGWITGTPIIGNNSIGEFSFQVSVRKASNPAIVSPTYRFSFRIYNNILGDITWITDSNLGSLNSGEISYLSVSASSDIDIQYRLVGGSLPPNLRVSSSGEIIGTVAFQPENTLQPEGTSVSYEFTIEAFSTQFNIVKSSKTFTLDIVIDSIQPTDTLYFKCTPKLTDRELLDTLLEDPEIIPSDMLYRPSDIYFGKASVVYYVHAYGIHSNNIEAYLAAVAKNHYQKNITLGEIKTAIATDQTGNVIYEVVYSTIIDDLVNPEGVSIPQEITWPRVIPTDEGDTRWLYPNSLFNMRKQIANELGQSTSANIYPRWMVSQQRDGQTLGFIPAWVICYTKPGYADVIKSNIDTNWKNSIGEKIMLNQINFEVDQFSVGKALTYSYDNALNPPTWTSLPSGYPVPDPIDNENFFVIFPRKTILPNNN